MTTDALPEPDELPTPLSEETELRLRHTHVEPLAEELAQLMVRLIDDRHTFLIVEVEGTERYVQFITTDGDLLRAESVGQRHLEGPARLTPADELELDRLGWMWPELDEGDCGNYWRMWTPPNILDAAQLAALTLCRVHHLASPGHATLTAAYPDD